MSSVCREQHTVHMYCSLNRSTVRRMILESDPRLIRQVRPAEVIAVARACRKAKVSHRQRQGGFIYPGKYVLHYLKHVTLISLQSFHFSANPGR
jgi:hypothetical protein